MGVDSALLRRTIGSTIESKAMSKRSMLADQAMASSVEILLGEKVKRRVCSPLGTMTARNT